MRAVVTTTLLLADGVAEASQRAPSSGVVSELQRLTAASRLAIQAPHSHFDPGFFPRSRGAMDPVGWPGRWPAFGAIMRWCLSDHPP